jgi:hypothetical protein
VAAVVVVVVVAAAAAAVETVVVEAVLGGSLSNMPLNMLPPLTLPSRPPLRELAFSLREFPASAAADIEEAAGMAAGGGVAPAEGIEGIVSGGCSCWYLVAVLVVTKECGVV